MKLDLFEPFLDIPMDTPEKRDQSITVAELDGAIVKAIGRANRSGRETYAEGLKKARKFAHDLAKDEYKRMEKTP